MSLLNVLASGVKTMLADGNKKDAKYIESYFLQYTEEFKAILYGATNVQEAETFLLLSFLACPLSMVQSTLCNCFARCVQISRLNIFISISCLIYKVLGSSASMHCPYAIFQYFAKIQNSRHAIVPICAAEP